MAARSGRTDVIGPRTAGRRRRSRAAFSDAFVFAIRGGEAAPGKARHELDACLTGRLGEDVLETARLLVSELVTNCVQHGKATRDQVIEVSGTLLARTLRVEVAGNGPGFAHAPTRPEPTVAGGRGLYLVEALSQGWGIETSPDRTAVWFEMACG